MGQAPLLANFIRASPKPLGAAAPKTPLKSRILARNDGILEFPSTEILGSSRGMTQGLGILEFLRNLI